MNLLSFVTLEYFEKLACILEVISAGEIFLKYRFYQYPSSWLIKNNFCFSPSHYSFQKHFEHKLRGHHGL